MLMRGTTTMNMRCEISSLLTTVRNVKHCTKCEGCRNEKLGIWKLGWNGKESSCYCRCRSRSCRSKTPQPWKQKVNINPRLYLPIMFRPKISVLEFLCPKHQSWIIKTKSINPTILRPRISKLRIYQVQSVNSRTYRISTISKK